MKYQNIVKGTFIKRPNRFIAHVLIDGKEEICHVKNTGRCKELLTSGATVLLEKSSNPSRKTAYDLISVYKKNRLINMDSQAPNKVADEWLRIRFPDTFIKNEKAWEDSRFDFYIENGEEKIFVEVKGVTLEKDGVVLFPDAPTERGVKHINGLIRWASEGNKAMVLFIVQMNNVSFFTPNKETHPEFAEALLRAKEQGVEVVAVDCEVGENTLTFGKEIEIKF
ncbi:MAG: DNA/RNA nuclease SfsA [Clostridia bacterium]|nr:DNA/RNA nuclease SfsA [Clostridia bacterium]